jgi:hypothetical protein
MSEFDELAASYIATWNETDPGARRELLARVWSADGRYIDPMADAEGIDAIDTTVHAVQQQFPGMVFNLVGPVDGHHDSARFRWELGPVDAPSLIEGFDVVHRDGDGKLALVLGFLDKVPA